MTVKLEFVQLGGMGKNCINKWYYPSLPYDDWLDEIGSGAGVHIYGHHHWAYRNGVYLGSWQPDACLVVTYVPGSCLAKTCAGSTAHVGHNGFTRTLPSGRSVTDVLNGTRNMAHPEWDYDDLCYMLRRVRVLEEAIYLEGK